MLGVIVCIFTVSNQRHLLGAITEPSDLLKMPNTVESKSEIKTNNYLYILFLNVKYWRNHVIQNEQKWQYLDNICDYSSLFEFPKGISFLNEINLMGQPGLASIAEELPPINSAIQVKPNWGGHFWFPINNLNLNMTLILQIYCSFNLLHG